jgi:uncharacterized protein YmfQ (DUF2313 family)
MTDLVNQLIKLLPTGEAWSSSPTSNLYKTIALFAGAFTRAFAFADYATTDTFPLTAADSIVDWQASVGLPDPLCPPLTTTQLRQQMIARVENLGGQSPEYFIEFAAKIGYTITITELACPRVGQAKVGLCQTNGPYGDFTWVVTVANATLNKFRASRNRAGDPLSSASSIAWLQYEFDRIKPSQTLIEWQTT